MRQAVILAGGAGTRLKKKLEGKPKSLVDIDGVPLLGRQFALLRRYDFENVLLLVHHGADQIASFCSTRHVAGLRIDLIDDGSPHGTAGALLRSLPRLSERFIVLYGDTLLDVDLARFADTHQRSAADATIFLHPNAHPYDSDLVQINDEAWITAIRPYPHPTNNFYPNLVNAALYAFERSALERWKDFHTPSDLAKHLFPAMIEARQRLYGYVSFEYIKDIGTPERLDAAISDLRTGRIARSNLNKPQKAVFVDRDGTLNRKLDYIRRPEDLVLYEGVGTAVRQLNGSEYRVVVVTNQPVVARGDCTLDDLRQIHGKMEQDLAQSGAYIDRIYFCPHHPDRGYAGEVDKLKIACNCRKPAVGLIDLAVEQLNISRAGSWLVGDTTTDILTAARAGLRSVLVRTGDAGNDKKHTAKADFVVDDLPAAVAFILNDYSRLAAAARAIIEATEPGDVVLLGGLAKVGKSTFAHVISVELREEGFDPKVISLDRWIRDFDQRGEGVLGRFDLDAMIDTLSRWLVERRHTDLILPRYDRIARRRDSVTDLEHLTAEAVLILEGVPALTLDLPGRRRVHRVHIDGAEDQRRDRVLSDLIVRDYHPARAHATYVGREVDESPVVMAARVRADTIIDLDLVLSVAPKDNL